MSTFALASLSYFLVWICDHLCEIPSLLQHRLHVHLNRELQVIFLLQQQHLCDDIVGFGDEVLRLFEEAEVQQIFAQDVQCDGISCHVLVVEFLFLGVTAWVASLLQGLTLLDAERMLNIFEALLRIVDAEPIVLHFLLKNCAGQARIGDLCCQV